MLKTLSGNKHVVVTGFCCLTEKDCVVEHEISEVEFNILSDEQIKVYIQMGLHVGKAGSYGIQDGYNLVKSYSGHINNIIGLPTEKVGPIIRKLINDK